MKQIIILDVAKDPAGNTLTLRYLFWFAIPTGKEKPVLSSSVYPKASSAENAAILSGQVIEELNTTQVAANFTSTQIKNALQTAYANRQTQLLNQLNAPNSFAGLYWDGTSWN